MYTAPKARLRDQTRSEKSLFPGYIFCRLPIGYQRAISLTAGALGLLGIPAPTVFNEDDFSTLQKALRSRLPIEVLPFVQRTKKVRVVKGPLCGLTGFVLNRQGDRYFAIPIKAVKLTLAFKLGNCSIQFVHRLSRPTRPVQQYKERRHRRSNLN
jgi:transcription antitermination factor NusG